MDPNESAKQELLRLEAHLNFLHEVETYSLSGVEQFAGERLHDGGFLRLRTASGDRFPAFQFTPKGTLLPVVGEVMQLFEKESHWAIALWFYGNSGWLSGVRPVDLIHERPQDVVDAARRTAAPLDH